MFEFDRGTRNNVIYHDQFFNIGLIGFSYKEILSRYLSMNSKESIGKIIRRVSISMVGISKKPFSLSFQEKHIKDVNREFEVDDIFNDIVIGKDTRVDAEVKDYISDICSKVKIIRVGVMLKNKRVNIKGKFNG